MKTCFFVQWKCPTIKEGFGVFLSEFLETQSLDVGGPTTVRSEMDTNKKITDIKYMYI